MSHQVGHSSKKLPRSPEPSEIYKKYILSHTEAMLSRNKYYLPAELEKTLTDYDKINEKEHNKKQ